MKAAWLVLLAACGGERSPEVPVEVKAERVELPSDAELGELAIMGALGDPDSWVPGGRFAFTLGRHDEARTWRATDAGGAEVVVSNGPAETIPYGCEGHQLEVGRLLGAPKGPTQRCPELGDAAFQPGVLWLRPVSSTWAAKPVEIANVRSVTPARRELVIGHYIVEIVRTDPMRGAVSVLYGHKLVHQMTFERAVNPLDDDPIDLLDPGRGLGIPVPEAAWSVDGERVLMVFRVQDTEGVSFKTIVVGPDSGRTVRSMGAYLERCGLTCG